jgi:tRNA-splicing ligase RtcB
VENDALVFATPDIHTGYGVPIGSVFASGSYISPSAVGYDINCGMRLIATDIPSSEVPLMQIANSIHRDIPLGEGKHNVQLDEKNFIRLLKKGVKGLEEISTGNHIINRFFNVYDWERNIHRIEENGSLFDGNIIQSLSHAVQRGKSQLGTLGGGNHFIELQTVKEIFDKETAEKWGIKLNNFVVMIHSGSRGFGHEIAGYYMRKSREYCERHGLAITDKQFTYFPANSGEGREYLSAMNLASNFAFLNREIMAMICIKHIREVSASINPEIVYDVSHNIVKEEIYSGRKYYVHRKGATRAFDKKLMKDTPFENAGQPVLIPGSMGTSSYLLCGTESGIESLFSVNHGAGRIMGRRAAAGKVSRKGKVIQEGAVSDREFKEQMKGILLICEDKHSIKEEAPSAYKEIDEVIETVTGAGLAKKVAKFIPLAVLKG